MQSLQNLLVFLYIPLSCVMSAAKENKVFGYEQREVQVSCPYEDGYESYKKYLCRNDCDYNYDVVITTTEMKKDRYSVHDDQQKHVFTVTISNLHYADAGIYWCMVERFLWDLSTAEVKVEVVPEWCCVKTNKLSGIVGRPVTLQCPYPAQHWDNRKFLCKGDHHNNCTDMVTSQSRFTLQDDVSSSSFLVMITELKAGDAATYWCGSDSQWSPGNYTKIQLSAVFPKQTSTVRSTRTVSSTRTVVDPVGSQMTHIPGEHIKDAALFYPVVFVMSAVLLILIFALMVVYKCKCYKERGAEVNMNRNQTRAAEAEDVISVADIYENEDVVAHSKQETSKPQSTCDHNDDASENQSVYQNFAKTEDIYCNKMYIKANRR